MKAAKQLLRSADRWQRKHPIASFPVAVLKRFGEDEAGHLAAVIAYYGFLSLFPLLLVATTVLGLVLHDDPGLRGRLLDSALAGFPVLGAQIRDNVGSIRGSGLSLTVGIALALWAGLGGVKAAQSAMDTVWAVARRKRPSGLKAIPRALVMLLSLGVFIVASAALAGASGAIEGPAGARAAAILGAAALNIALFVVAFRVLTVAPLSWRDVAPGAALAGLAWTGLTLMGGWIVQSRVSSASETYGFFGIVIGLLAWIYLGAQVTLLGAEVNVVRARRLWPRSLDPATTTKADRASTPAS